MIEEVKGVTKIFFELANEERIEIMKILTTEEVRLTDIARRMKQTTSETSRHLTRLQREGLVEKTPDGLYTASNYGRLLFFSIPYFEFANRHKEFIQTHDFTVIPTEFIARIGEARDSKLIDGSYQVIDVQNMAVAESQKRIWIMSPEPFESMAPLFESKVAAGVDLRIILPVDTNGTDNEPPSGWQLKRIPEVPMLVSVLDDRGGLCLPNRDGRPDISVMLAGTRGSFYKWLEDLFLYYWKFGDHRQSV